jgi:hypothetical protein
MLTTTLLTFGVALTAFLVTAIPSAHAQYFGGESGALTKEQLAFCEQYGINPCTQNNILAKERLLGAQNNPSGSETPMLSTLGEPTITENGNNVSSQIPMDWSIIGIVIVAVVAVVAVAIVAIKIKHPTHAEKV